MSADNEGEFFEGPEKLMEMWFEADCESTKSKDLRTITRSKWETLLDLVHCKIISTKSTKKLDAYLLSESSLYVSKNRVILKTCGTTTLLYAIKPLIELVKEECGLNKVKDIFYSRKNYQKPHLQDHPHQSFEQEIVYLDKLFDKGAAYSLGQLNGDTWYLYTLDNDGVDCPDQTLEILMNDLDPEVMQYFYSSKCSRAAEATKITGIADLIPGAIIDDFMFEPCGYSMNGILEDSYFTIHVTPQDEFSYVSFETDIDRNSYTELVENVLKIFRPGKFLMTLFTNHSAVCGSSYSLFKMPLKGFKRKVLQYYEFKNYDLTYGHYERLKKGDSSERENSR